MSAVATNARAPRVTGRAIVAWVVLCTLTAVLLGPLRHSAPGPQSFDESGVRLFIDQFGPSAPLLWLIRLGASAAAVVHLTLLTLGLMARVIGAMRAVRVLDRISPATLRRLFTPIAVVSLTGTMSLSALSPASAATPTAPPPAVMVVATPIPAATSTTLLAPATIEVDSTVIPPSPSTASVASTPVASPAASTAADSTSVPVIGGTVVVARGDSLWSIAEDALRAHLGHAPTEHETSQYWRALIDANRGHLRDHDDPGLIFAGQQFVLP